MVDKRKACQSNPQVPLAGREVARSARTLPEGRRPGGQPLGSSVAHKVRPQQSDLLEGVEVTEFEATLPIEMYGELFKHHSSGDDS